MREGGRERDSYREKVGEGEGEGVGETRKKEKLKRERLFSW